MSEFTMMDGSGAVSYQTTEHYLRRVLVGNIETVRRRLIAALERLGYDLLDDEELLLRGRRGAVGWATSYSSADVLDYPRTLVVKLKPLSAHSTRVTFDYIIKHPSLSRGEKEVLTREAEAITALATVHIADRLCAACGTETTDDSRFCRRCGAPMTGEENALEVLRMTAEVRAGHTSVSASAIIMLIISLFMLAVLIGINASGLAVGKYINFLLVFGSFLSVLNLLFICFGWNRLSRALKSKTGEQLIRSVNAAPAFAAPPTTAELPPAPAASMLSSVTEGTTELLNPPEREKSAVPIRRERENKDRTNQTTGNLEPRI